MRVLSCSLALLPVLASAQAPRPAQSSAPRPTGAAPAPTAAPVPRAKAVPSSKPQSITYTLPLPDTNPPAVHLPTASLRTLPNGLRYLVAQNPSLPIVDVAVLIAHGYAHDPKGRRGLTRALAQSLRYGGTRDRSPADIEAFLSERQISLQASVGPDLIEFSARCRKDDVSGLLALIAGMITKPAFRRNAIEEFIAQETLAIRNHGRNPGQAAEREAETAWFGPESAWTRRQRYEDVRSIDRDAILAHYAAAVVPARVLVGFDGDIDAAAAGSLTASHFGSWQAAASSALAVASIPSAERKLIAIDQPNATSTLLLLLLPWKQRAAERSPEVAAALGLFAAQWDQRQPASLTNVLAPYKSEDGPARITTGLSLGGVPGMQLIGAVRPRETIDASVALWKQVQTVRSEKTAAAKLESLRRQYLRSLVFQSASRGARFRLLMQSHALGVSPGYLEAVQKAAATMTPAEYDRIVAEQLSLDAAIMVLAGDERDYRSPPSTIGFPLTRATLTAPEEPEMKPDDSEAGRAKALELLSQATQAMGGAAVLDALRDATWDYEATLTRASPPLVIKQHNRWMMPRFYRQEQQSTLGAGISFYDGAIGWTHNGRTLMSLNPLSAAQFRNEVIRLLFRLVRAGQLEGYSVAYASAGTVIIRSPENYAVELALDFDTHLPERLRFLEQRPNDGGIVRVEERLSDYKSVGGVLMPHRITVIQNGQMFADFQMTGIQFNTGLTEEEISRKP